MSHSRFLEVPDDVTDDQIEEIMEEVYQDACNHDDDTTRGFSAGDDSWNRADSQFYDCDLEDTHMDQRVTFVEGKPVFEEVNK